jgi:hypothetical protein
MIEEIPMPLRDHFHPPLTHRCGWKTFHHAWVSTMAFALNRELPAGFEAQPEVQIGSLMAIDVATRSESPRDPEVSGGVLTATWAPPAPTSTLPADLGDLDEFEVRIYDRAGGSRLVAAVELVSPSNKDWLDHREAFVAKCFALLQAGVSVMIVDIVSSRFANLGRALIAKIAGAESVDGDPQDRCYAMACRWVGMGPRARLETWSYPVAIGQPLPTLPLWLDFDLAIPLVLEATYEETCRNLRLS